MISHAGRRRCAGFAILPVMCGCLFLVGVAASAGAPDPARPTALGMGEAQASSIDGAALLEEAWGLVETEFFDPKFNAVDWQAALERHQAKAAAARSADETALAINEMLSELRTSHTMLYHAREQAYYELADIFSAVIERDDRLARRFPEGIVKYEGIGIVAREHEDGVFIHDVLEGSPAAEAGLLVGDEIVSADGKPFHEIESFHGRAGADVAIEIRRTSDPASRRVIPVRPQWIVPHELFNESIKKSAKIIELHGRKAAYVRVRSYASAEYHETLKQLILEGTLREAESLVLDLRGGWGGAMPSYFNLFNPDAPTLRQLHRDGSANLFETAWRKPMVVLVDHGTRSGKEILAHAFKTSKRAVLVGERTAGAVVGGRAYVLSDGSLLMIAVQDVQVDGVRLEGVGVEPDVEVKWDVRYAAGNDPQVERAIEIAATTRPKAIDKDEAR